MPKEKSIVTKYVVLSNETANTIDINDFGQLKKIKLYNDIDEARRICQQKDQRSPYKSYDVYELQFELYLFKKYKDS